VSVFYQKTIAKNAKNGVKTVTPNTRCKFTTLSPLLVLSPTTSGSSHERTCPDAQEKNTLTLRFVGDNTNHGESLKTSVKLYGTFIVIIEN